MRDAGSFLRDPRPILSRLRYGRIRSVSVDLTADEISATGGRRRFAPARVSPLGLLLPAAGVPALAHCVRERFRSISALA